MTVITYVIFSREESFAKIEKWEKSAAKVGWINSEWVCEGARSNSMCRTDEKDENNNINKWEQLIFITWYDLSKIYFDLPWLAVMSSIFFFIITSITTPYHLKQLFFNLIWKNTPYFFNYYIMLHHITCCEILYKSRIELNLFL